MKEYEVWIYDSESGCTQPMKCRANSLAEAKRKGYEYIRIWDLRGGEVINVEEVKTA